MQGSNPAGVTFAGIAQLAVRITCNDEVIGSIPIVSSCWKAKKIYKTFAKNIHYESCGILRQSERGEIGSA